MVFPEAFVRGGAPVVSAFFADFLAANCVYIFGAADIARRATTRAQRHQRTTAGVPELASQFIFALPLCFAAGPLLPAALLP